MERASTRIQTDILGLAIDEMKQVLEGKRAMSDVGACAFKLVGDYAKVMGAENQKGALELMQAKYTDRKALNAPPKES